MNDLAEKALHGVAVARRQVRARATLCFAVLGFVLAVGVVVAGGAVGAAQPTRPLTTWLGLQDSSRDVGRTLSATVLLVAIVTFVLLWLVLVEFVRRSAQPQSRVWWVAAAWAVPFAVGPPLMDTSVYSSAAYGLLQRRGHDPYHSVPTRLGDSPVVAAIDPASRGTPSGAGPLGSLVQHLSVSAANGSALGAVIILRVVAVLATIWIGRLAADLGGARADRALTLTVLNPLVLLYLVSAAHLDVLTIAFALGAVVTANQRQWLAAVSLACLAGSVTGQGFVVLVVIVAVHVVGRRSMPVWQVLRRDVVAAALVTGVLGLIVSGGFGWLTSVSKQFSEHTPFSVAGATAIVLRPIVRDASYDDFAIGGRITAATAMVCVIAYLVCTARHRALELSAGYALLAVGLLAPVLHPWYLLWGALCLAPTARGARRVAVQAICAAGCVLALPGFSDIVTDVLTGALLLAAAASAGFALAATRASARGGSSERSAGQADDPRPARRDRGDVARLRAFRRPGRRDVDAL